MNIAVCIGIAEIELAFAGGIDRIQLVLEILAVHIDAGFLGGIRQSGLMASSLAVSSALLMLS